MAGSWTRWTASSCPDARLTQGQLYGIVNAIRLKETTYKSSGSVHGCALFKEDDLLIFVEDVGRHNAIDTIAGWMWMNPETCSSSDCAGDPATSPMSGADKVFYTTGRLTSEMVIKSAQMGVPIVVSRSGMTQMGHAVAQQLGLCAIGRATNRRFCVLQRYAPPIAAARTGPGTGGTPRPGCR